MELNVNIDPEQINQVVANAVLQSAIGIQVEKIVKDHVAKLGQSWENPLDAVVKRHIGDLVLKVLTEEHAETLKAKVSEAVTAHLTEDFISKILQRGIGNL